MTEYITTKKEALEEFIVKMEERLAEENVQRMTGYNRIVNEEAQKILKRLYRRRVLEEERVEEKPWMNEEIRQKVKERKNLNRMKRNERNPTTLHRLEALYEEKKKEVMVLVKEAITEYEIKITNEIKNNKNEVWKNIKKLTK